MEVWWRRGNFLGVATECLGGGNKLGVSYRGKRDVGGLLEMNESGEGEQEPGALSLYMLERPKTGRLDIRGLNRT